MISASSHRATSPSARFRRATHVGIGALAMLVLAACGGDEAAPAGTTAGTGEVVAEGEVASDAEGATTAEGAASAGGAVTAEEMAALEERIAALEAAVVRLTGEGGGAADAGATEEHDEAPVAEESAHETEEGAAAEPPHWDYEEAEAWGSLSPEYAACDTGTQQSPINLVEPEAKDLENATFEYLPSTASIVNNGHTVQVNLDAGGSMWLDDVEYRLVQFHFHGPSEHTVDGDSFPLEIHFVHKSAEGAFAVLGVMVEVGEEDGAWADLIASLPTELGTETALGFDVDATALMPEIRAAYRYSGSLTTPPCTEGVEWQVLIATAHMSGAQIDAIRAQFAEENNRPVQPLGERELDVDLSW